MKILLQQQIYERLRRQMAEGTLAPGQRVPSLRGLASELGVARGTVAVAYERLTGEGWLVARGAAGTFVAEDAQVPARGEPPRAARSRPRPPQPPAPLRLGLPALDAFPRKLWARLVARHARASSSTALDRPDPAGHGPLRAAIATYLGRSRGVRCTARQVFVLPAYPAALELVCRVLLRPGDAAWVESPGYPATARVLAQAGLRAVPVPVDGDGLVVAEGLRRARRALPAVLTPSPQSPLGVALALPRRQALLDWARAAGAFIAEDDYDGEYRYRGHPLPALHSLDTEGRVLYLGTFSKVLFPGLRLAYVVVPEACVEAFEAGCALSLHQACPELYQAVVAEFLEQGHFARHVRKMRALYAQRRAWLAQALAVLQPEGLVVEPGHAGMHLILRSHRAEPDTELARRAQAAGLGVQALSPWGAEGRGPQGLLAGFTNVASEAQARRLAAQLRRALRAP